MKLINIERLLDDEEWKILYYNNKPTSYQISSYGFIRNRSTMRRLTGSHDRRGYRTVTLHLGRKMKTFLLHRLVAITFIPNPENKPQVNHKDGNKDNNAISNLEWATCKENIDHAIATGLRDLSGMKASSNVYTDEQVHDVCLLLQNGKSCRQVSDLLGVNINLPRRILYLGKWKHISSLYKLPTTIHMNELKLSVIQQLRSGNTDPSSILKALHVPINNFNIHFVKEIKRDQD